MLHPFVSAKAHDAAPEQIGGASVSIAFHVFIIVATIVVTGVTHVTATASTHEIGLPPAQHLQFVKLSALPSEVLRAKAAALAARASAKARLVVPTLPNLAPLALGKLADIVAPQIDFAQQTAQWAAAQLASEPASNNVITDVLRRMYAPAPTNPNAIYSPDVVEKIAEAQPDNPRPPYPRAMLNAGIEATVRVQFVVDSTGRVDDKSLSYPGTAERMFVDAIRFALHHSRYFPAEFAGRHVAQMVSQEFVFRIEH